MTGRISASLEATYRAERLNPEKRQVILPVILYHLDGTVYKEFNSWRAAARHVKCSAMTVSKALKSSNEL
jgi:hypothetical protein